ncbi:MAG: NUDIX domain-containing protein [Acidimicrobiia bacterium]|nr:NUDIX domain-containing protein [Acidimicrobiia bacterium]MDH4366019.1 NUDIX domain-containing protein [Acidimicrobiia bacterium]MDH5290202.1 NUDIX domain-containing protein [Acidimicrobiia bacterium]
MTDRFRLVPAAYVILRRRMDDREEILLQLRQNTGYRDGYWATAAAGHVEAGESVVAAGCREAAEELGVVVAPADLVAITAMHRTAGNGDPIEERVDFFFQCRRWQGEPRLMEPHKSAGIGWFSLDQLPEPVVPHEATLFRWLAHGGPAPVTSFGFPDS